METRWFLQRVSEEVQVLPGSPDATFLEQLRHSWRRSLDNLARVIPIWNYQLRRISRSFSLRRREYEAELAQPR
jgi:hypothetical protein